MGTKRKPHNEVVRVRLPSDLAAAIKNRAKVEVNGNSSRLIRRALNAYLSDLPKIDGLIELRGDLQRIQNHMGGINRNLNQLTRFYNIHGAIEKPRLAEVLTEMRWACRALVIKQRALIKMLTLKE